MASQETVRVDFSPLIAPKISSAIAPAARMISDSAGAMSGTGSTGIRPGLRQAGAAHARRLVGGRHLLDQVVDRFLDRAQERERVNSHPDYQDEQGNKQRLLAYAEIEHPAQVGAGERAVNYPPIHVEHVHRAEEQCRCRDSAFERVDPEGAE